MPLELDSSLDPPKTPVRLGALGMAESESPANALFDPRCRPSTPGMFTPPERSFEPPADDRLLVSALTESTPMTCKTKFCVHVKMTTSVTAMYTPVSVVSPVKISSPKYPPLVIFVFSLVDVPSSRRSTSPSITMNIFACIPSR